MDPLSLLCIVFAEGDMPDGSLACEWCFLPRHLGERHLAELEGRHHRLVLLDDETDEEVAGVTEVTWDRDIMLDQFIFGNPKSRVGIYYFFGESSDFYDDNRAYLEQWEKQLKVFTLQTETVLRLGGSPCASRKSSEKELGP